MNYVMHVYKKTLYMCTHTAGITFDSHRCLLSMQISLLFPYRRSLFLDLCIYNISIYISNKLAWTLMFTFYICIPISVPLLLFFFFFFSREILCMSRFFFSSMQTYFSHRREYILFTVVNAKKLVQTSEQPRLIY